MTRLAFSWIVNVTPSSDEKDFIGDNVPDVKTIVQTFAINIWKGLQGNNIKYVKAFFKKSTKFT